MSAAAELIHELREAGYHLSRRGDKLHIVAPPNGEIDDALKSRLLERKPELLELLTSAKMVGNPLRVVQRFRLPHTAPNSWATALGAPGETRESLIAELRGRWPNVEIGS